MFLFQSPSIYPQNPNPGIYIKKKPERREYLFGSGIYKKQQLWTQKRASDLHRTATTKYPCFGQDLGDSKGAGRVGLTRVQRYYFFPYPQNFTPLFHHISANLHKSAQIILFNHAPHHPNAKHWGKSQINAHQAMARKKSQPAPWWCRLAGIIQR